jgi:hypothetical protein
VHRGLVQNAEHRKFEYASSLVTHTRLHLTFHAQLSSRAGFALDVTLTVCWSAVDRQAQTGPSELAGRPDELGVARTVRPMYRIDTSKRYAVQVRAASRGCLVAPEEALLSGPGLSNDRSGLLS